MARNNGMKSTRGQILFGSIQIKLLLLLFTLLFPAIFIQVYICNGKIASRRAEELQVNVEIARAIAGVFPAYVGRCSPSGTCNWACPDFRSLFSGRTRWIYL